MPPDPLSAIVVGSLCLGLILVAVVWWWCESRFQRPKESNMVVRPASPNERHIASQSYHLVIPYRHWLAGLIVSQLAGWHRAGSRSDPTPKQIAGDAVELADALIERLAADMPHPSPPPHEETETAILDFDALARGVDE